LRQRRERFVQRAELETLIAALPEPSASPAWKRRVLAALDEPLAALPQVSPGSAIASARRRAPRWIGAAGLAIAAAFVLWLVVRPGRELAERAALREPAPTTEAAIEATTEIRRAGVMRSSDLARVGDTWIVRVTAAAAIELRIYGDADEPIARCREGDGCQVTRDGAGRHYVLEVPLAAHGTVRALVFTGDAMPPGFDHLDADAAAAHARGTRAQQIAVVRVQ
jgi:hypothetical protein